MNPERLLEEVDVQPAKTVARAILILESYTREQAELGVRALARELRTNPTTVHRLLTTLKNLGYLKQDPDSQGYRLGPRVMRLAELYRVHNPLSEVAKQVFEEYSGHFKHNFYLGELVGYEVIYVAVYDGKAPLRIAIEPGGTTALHSTAMGKVLMAFREDSYIEEFLQRHELFAHTPQTIISPDNLLEEIQQIRRNGFAINNGEHYEEIAAIARPILDEEEKAIAGMCLAFPRLDSDMDTLFSEDLIYLSLKVAREIATRYGGL